MVSRTLCLQCSKGEELEPTSAFSDPQVRSSVAQALQQAVQVLSSIPGIQHVQLYVRLETDEAL